MNRMSRFSRDRILMVDRSTCTDYCQSVCLDRLILSGGCDTRQNVTLSAINITI